MKFFKNAGIILNACILLAFLISPAYAGDKLPNPETYLPGPAELSSAKKLLDDPRSLLTKYHPSKMLPPELWAKLTYDQEEMKALWAEVVGFKSTDVVGKVAPEIKPGKYTYKDLEKYPGLKELFPPEFLACYIKPGGPPHVGNIPEFEIIPTRQYYYSLPIAKATKENMGKAKLDDQGYIIQSSWEAGYPFPRPSGKHKGQQLVANHYNKYYTFGNNQRITGLCYGYDKNLKKDFDCLYFMDAMRLSKRACMPPFGYYDGRAEKNKEDKTFMQNVLSPRDIRGTSVLQYFYEDRDRFTQSMMYVPSLRRIRKMSASDTQDPMNGMDIIYDDQTGFDQKITPNRYPYKFEASEMKEYLWPVSVDGTEYIDSKEGFSLKNVKMMRRPMYAVNCTQQDKNYVYGRRLVYFDAETFLATIFFNYDQKGRLYRTQHSPLYFLEECGQFFGNGTQGVLRDYVDEHTTVMQIFSPPAFWDRSHFSMKNMSKLK